MCGIKESASAFCSLCNIQIKLADGLLIVQTLKGASDIWYGGSHDFIVGCRRVSAPKDAEGVGCRAC